MPCNHPEFPVLESELPNECLRCWRDAGIKEALKNERRRIREAAQSLPNAKDVERVIFATQTLPPATKQGNP
jgi:hypothetical protein